MREIRRKQFFSFFEGFFDKHANDSVKMRHLNFEFTDKEKADLLNEIVVLLRSFRRPFILLGDWNCSPQELIASGFVRAVKGRCIHTQEDAVTQTVWGRAVTKIFDDAVSSEEFAIDACLCNSLPPTVLPPTLCRRHSNAMV